MPLVKHVINDAKNVVSFEIAGIKEDIGFATTDQLSEHHLAKTIIIGVQDDDVYFDRESEAFKFLVQKYDEGILAIFVGSLALPTHSYSNGRVMLSETPFLGFMNRAISAYVESIKPKKLRKFFRAFMCTKRKRRYEDAQKRYERCSKIEASDISYSLQNLGIVSHNPYGNFDGLVINI